MSLRITHLFNATLPYDVDATCTTNIPDRHIRKRN